MYVVPLYSYRFFLSFSYFVFSYFSLLVLLSFLAMDDATEILCLQRNFSECEVDPAICASLNDGNTAEDNITIPSYDHIKDTTSFDILTPTNLTHVPRFILRKFPKLLQIRLINTGIIVLNVNSFAGGKYLQQLDLRRNRIALLPAKTFGNLNRLETLNLAYNRIERIEPDAFYHVPALKNVILSNNMLETIEMGSFTGAANLTELYLESNRIHSIEENALSLPNLEIISLKDNRLKTLSKTVFEAAHKLEKVDLSNNDFEEIGELFNNKQSLYSLNLCDNPELKDADLFRLTEQIPNLSYLLLANTGFKLTNEPDADAEEKASASREEDGNHSLTHLDLSSNNLNSPDIFLHLTHFKSLKTIVLSNNNFSYLNHIALLKGLFPRLTTIKFKYNPNIDLNWLRRALPILAKQNIKLVSEQQIN